MLVTKILLNLVIIVNLHTLPVVNSSSSKSLEDALHPNIHELLREFNNMKDRVSILEHELSDVKERLNHETLERKHLQRQLDSQVQMFDINCTKHSENPIAFAVHDTSPDAGEPDFEGTLKFQLIDTNFGSYYDNDTGYFTCPLKGLYMFSFNLLSHVLANGEDIYARLRIDGVDRWYAHSQNANSEKVDLNSGATMIVECDIGSLVEVYKFGNGRLWTGGYSWFTGFLIRPL